MSELLDYVHDNEFVPFSVGLEAERLVRTNARLRQHIEKALQDFAEITFHVYNQAHPANVAAQRGMETLNQALMGSVGVEEEK